MARVNRYPGRCAQCGKTVAAGKGNLYRGSSRWIVRHRTCERTYTSRPASTRPTATPSEPNPKPWRWVAGIAAVVLAFSIFGSSSPEPSQDPDPTPAATVELREPTPSTSTYRPTSCVQGYLNVDGDCVSGPVSAPAPPPGATAQCRNGKYSFSQNRRGTCSHHGGVARWLP